MKGDDEQEIAGQPEKVATISRFRRSPLTDPRALVASLLIHLVLVATGSVLAFRVIKPRVDSAPGRTMRGELESTDNRATSPSGGNAGQPEGRAADLSADPGIPAPRSKDPAADALISEILPTKDSSEMVSETLPGPSTSGLGMLHGEGTGEGGGPSSGSTGAVGKSTGPGTEFFGMNDKGGSYAYVIDCSGSMTARNSLDVAKRELLSSLSRISPEARFAVVFYNVDANVFTDDSGHAGLMPANPSNKARVRDLLSTVHPYAGTDHVKALRAAFALHPEVIFFLTDADLMSRQDVTDLVAQAGKTRIQAVEFGQVTGLGGSVPLQNLAKQTGGSYRYIDVNTFGH